MTWDSNQQELIEKSARGPALLKGSQVTGKDTPADGTEFPAGCVILSADPRDNPPGRKIYRLGTGKYALVHDYDAEGNPKQAYHEIYSAVAYEVLEHDALT